MVIHRLSIACLLLGLVGLPCLLPLYECLNRGDVSYFATDAQYLALLTRNTLFLVLGTLMISLPAGTFLAGLLFRSDLPGRVFWIAATVLSLFVPLPVLMSAWITLLGAHGLCPFPGWQAETTGLIPAIGMHSLAGIPWVILIVGNGLCWIERELEEDALLQAGPWRVFWKVTLPRCRGSLIAAALWLSLATFAEIGVTYYLQLPTVAEEVYTQFGSGNPAALARSVLLSLPFVLVLTGLLLWFLPRLERSLPALQGWLAPPRPMPLGRLRWPLASLLAVLVGILALAPLVSLFWKVGLAGMPSRWSLNEAWTRLFTEARMAHVEITLLPAAATPVLTAVFGLICCWQARDSRWFRVVLLFLTVLAWSLPGPVIGLGLLELINLLLPLNIRPLNVLLYYGPSPMPIIWGQMIRFLPVAVALLWPWVRTVPRELLESARMEGARPVQELTKVTWPLVARGFGWTVLILTALSLGEVAVSGPLKTPGWDAFTSIVLDRMHYGVEGSVAALCLILEACVLAAFGIVFLSWKVVAVITTVRAGSVSDGPQMDE